MLASMVAISLLFRMRAEDIASVAGAGAEQASAAAMSGVQEALQIATRIEAGSLDWRNSPELFKDRLFHDDGVDKWYFTIFSAGDAETELVRFGLTDEASKLDLNEASEAMLARVPGLKLSQAQALWDFLDVDNTPRPEGAEQEYYDTLATPYTGTQRAAGDDRRVVVGARVPEVPGLRRGCEWELHAGRERG